MFTAFAATANPNDVAGNTASELAKLIELILTKIPLWIAAFIIIVACFIAAKVARNIVENKLAEKGIEEDHKEIQILGGRITYSIILVLGITVGLKVAGIDLTTIIAAVAFGIGFALKDLIMNFIAGILILVGRHFAIGDFINVGGTIGKVVEIQSRVTILQAVDGTKVIVPNGEIFKSQVTSFTSNPFRRIEVTASVDYRSDIENAMKICMNILKTTKGVLAEPKPAVLVHEFGDYTIDFVLRGWVESTSGWLKIKSELMKRIKNDFDKYSISVPWPMTQMVYDKDFPIEEKQFIEEAKEKNPAITAPPVVQIHQADIEDVPANPVPVAEVAASADVAATVTAQTPPAPQTLSPGPEKSLKPLNELT